jgi:Ca-activated chloride channel family protein
MYSRIFSILLGVALLCGLAAAQAPPAPQQPATGSAPGANAAGSSGTSTSGDDIPKIVSRSDEVNVIFTVTDKHGKFIKDLKQNQFKILDDNRPPQRVLDFKSETDLPLRVGLLIDASNSIRDRFLFEQQAAVEFLHQTIRPKTDKAFVLAFDEVWETTQDFTSDLDKLTKGVNAIRPGGGTAMWDAVYYACRDKLMKESTGETVRRVIILVSDGDDNQSRALRSEAIEMAQRAGVIIYTISTNLSNIHDTGDHNLKALADATGGQAFFPFKLQNLTDDFNDIQAELRSQYSLSYKPDQFQANGQFRAIQIIPDDKKLKIRAKKGYYVPK